MTQFKVLEVRLTGIAPLLMHNGALADPSSDCAKEISKITSLPKKQKTEAKLMELHRLEFMGGLYLNGDELPCIPGENIESMLVMAAKGTEKNLHKSISSGVWCEASFPLIYKGPKTADEMWDSGRFHLTKSATIQRKKVQRTRPIFREWAVDVRINYNPDVVNVDSIKACLVMAGTQVGLCDWRPKYGRFSVEFKGR